MSLPMWNTGSINTARFEARRVIAPLVMFALCLAGVAGG